jgi:hypothetical protein
LGNPIQCNQSKNKINANFALFELILESARLVKAHRHALARLKNLGERLFELFAPLLAGYAQMVTPQKVCP